MSLQIRSCPAVVEAFETFTVMLGNADALPERPFVVEMTMVSETETLISGGKSDIHFVGKDIVQEDVCRSARFPQPPTAPGGLSLRSRRMNWGEIFPL
jgi:hypothetical protein